MTAPIDWLAGALLGSGGLMVVVLAVRGPARRWIGPRLAYLLWAVPAVRLIVPPLPAGPLAALPVTTGAHILVAGASAGLGDTVGVTGWPVGTVLVALWLTGAVGVIAVQVGRYLRFRRALLAAATDLSRHGAVRVVAAAVAGPVAFGVVGRTVAVPHDFATRFTPRERHLALAHELAHHARGDLVANWVSLVVLAAHWWNPVAWAAIRAFRDDQEFAVDAHVLAHSEPAARPDYARVLAKAAGIGGLPACNLTLRSTLKGRLTMLAQPPLPRRRVIVGGTTLALLAAGAVAMTVAVAGIAATPAGHQAVTIGVKPDGTGGFTFVVGGMAVAPGAALPGGATLPADLDAHGGCDLKPTAKAHAMVIKGFGGITTYTVMCASAASAPVRTTLDEGLASLKTMRGQVATQPASKVFPEAERRHALGAIDRSIAEVEATLAKAG